MLFVDASTDRVGIGEASPQRPLHVSAASSDIQVRLNRTTDASAGFGHLGANLNNAFHIYNSSVTKVAEFLQADGALRFPAGGGGVYLGGTGSANLLDDYEEGTFTPTVNNHNGSAGSTIAGRYVKVGRIVHCVGVITQDSGTVSGGRLQLASLPFTATQFGSAAVDSAGGFVLDSGRIQPDWNFVELKLNGVAISSGTNFVNICFSVTYETT
jgi:hypothetical protein